MLRTISAATALDFPTCDPITYRDIIGALHPWYGMPFTARKSLDEINHVGPCVDACDGPRARRNAAEFARRSIVVRTRYAVEIPKYSHAGSAATRVYDEFKSEKVANATAEQLRATGRYRFVNVRAEQVTVPALVDFGSDER